MNAQSIKVADRSTEITNAPWLINKRTDEIEAIFVGHNVPYSNSTMYAVSTDPMRWVNIGHQQRPQELRLVRRIPARLKSQSASTLLVSTANTAQTKQTEQTNTSPQVIAAGAQALAKRNALELLDAARLAAEERDLHTAYDKAFRGLDILMKMAQWTLISVELSTVTSDKFPVEFGIVLARFVSQISLRLDNWTSVINALKNMAIPLY